MLLTLLSECHFWTIRDDVRIKSTDLGTFRYYRNREIQQLQNQQPPDAAALAKCDYTERRNGIVVPKNTRKAGRLKDNIKKLEELMRVHKLVYSQWRDAAQLQLLFANGIIAYISVDNGSGDILYCVFDKYFVGKVGAGLAAETEITDAFFTRSHIVLAYNSNQLTVVYLQKQNMRSKGPEKISNMDPRIFNVILPGPSERKLARNLSVNCSVEMFVVWTKSSQNEVYPWRPTLRDQDRANIHVFKIKNMQLESTSYCWSENDPLCVTFLRSAESQIMTVEQKVSRKGEISAEICTYPIGTGKMQRNVLTSIPMGTQICCYALSPDQEKLFLGTIDRNICLHDLVQQTTKFVKQIEIIPTLCSWHCDSSIIMIGNDRAQFQCFDLALATIGSQLQSEDVTPANILDLSHYFTQQPTLRSICFSCKPDLVNFIQPYAQTDCFLLLVFDHGPIGCLRLFAGAGMRGDIHNSGLTADVLVEKYLALNQMERAVNLLMALNWETYGAMCLITLHKIANYLFCRNDIRINRIELMTKAFKTFSESLSEETQDDFCDQVYDLKRRFFFFLLRRNYYAEAFEVAQDIEDYDLFMDLFNLTKSNKELMDFAAKTFSQAVAILQQEDRLNSNVSLNSDHRSESTCSQSTGSDLVDHKAKTTQHNNVAKSYVPPMKAVHAEMIRINIPKPELVRVETHNAVEPQRSRPLPPSPPKNTRFLKVTAAGSTINNLATLAMKSGSNINGDKLRQLNGKTTDPPNQSTWKEIPEQTVGIPSMANATAKSYAPSTAHNILQRASAATNFNSTNRLLCQAPQYPLSSVHYATPAVVSEHSLISNQRNYQPNSTSAYQPKFFQHPLVSGTIPPRATSIHLNDEHQKYLLLKKPTASILSNTSSSHGSTTAQNGSTTSREVGNSKSNAGEKNKVKFSDTVQVAVVPDIPRKEKSFLAKRNGYARPPPRNITNPKKELADSLPLCHPNDDYLKDFNPLSAENTHRPLKSAGRESHNTTNKPTPTPPAIKVVHFGVV